MSLECGIFVSLRRCHSVCLWLWKDRPSLFVILLIVSYDVWDYIAAFCHLIWSHVQLPLCPTVCSSYLTPGRFCFSIDDGSPLSVPGVHPRILQTIKERKENGQIVFFHKQTNITTTQHLKLGIVGGLSTTIVSRKRGNFLS